MGAEGQGTSGGSKQQGPWDESAKASALLENKPGSFITAWIGVESQAGLMTEAFVPGRDLATSANPRGWNQQGHQ